MTTSVTVEGYYRVCRVPTESEPSSEKPEIFFVDTKSAFNVI